MAPLPPSQVPLRNYDPHYIRPLPPVEPTWPMPKFALRIDNLEHPGYKVFMAAVDNDPVAVLTAAVLESFTRLYTFDTVPRQVKTILLVLSEMGGVAHTLGSYDQKEIHYSLDYIKKSEARAKDEVRGVLVHEVVHCYQFNALQTCPGGLIEGMADFVRLHAGLAPPHWKRTGGEKWDAGYQTTAYFLDWIEQRYGTGIVQELNIAMKDRKFQDQIFKDLTGRPVAKLWKLYRQNLGEIPVDPRGQSERGGKRGGRFLPSLMKALVR